MSDLQLTEISPATTLDPKVQWVATEMKAILNGNITPASVAVAIAQGVLVMRKFVSLTGQEKKIILKTALYYLVANSELSADDKAACNLILDMGFSDMVDNLVMMASGIIKMEINKCGGCFGCHTADPA